MTRRTTISYVQQLRNPASDNYTVEPLELTLSFSSGLFSWLSSQKQNNMTHAYFGNIGIGVGVLTVYIVIKGHLSLHKKKSDIENIIKDYITHMSLASVRLISGMTMTGLIQSNLAMNFTLILLLITWSLVSLEWLFMRENLSK